MNAARRACAEWTAQTRIHSSRRGKNRLYQDRCGRSRGTRAHRRCPDDCEEQAIHRSGTRKALQPRLRSLIKAGIRSARGAVRTPGLAAGSLAGWRTSAHQIRVCGAARVVFCGASTALMIGGTSACQAADRFDPALAWRSARSKFCRATRGGTTLPMLAQFQCQSESKFRLENTRSTTSRPWIDLPSRVGRFSERGSK